MSFRSGSSIVLPESLQRALDAREINYPCPADVLKMLATIPFFQATPKPAGRGAPIPTSRFANLDRRSDDWRSAPSVPTPAGGHNYSSSGSGSGSNRNNRPDDGFEVWNGNRRRGHRNDDQRFAGRYDQTNRAPYVRAEHVRSEPVRSEPVRSEVQPLSQPLSQSLSQPVPVRTDPEPAASSVAKFSSAGVKASVTVEDRMLARVKGKINKIGASTYEATKVFMQQILDSEETGFLDEFMKFVFSKAATESAFCSLYAKLLHELADEFTHLRTVMLALFRDYIEIFKEVEETPDVGSSDYINFVEAQERKKFRRGYSQFVAELVKLGEADVDDFATLIHTIVDVIEANNTNSSKTLLCEEYIDCLANLCNSAPAILSAAKWSESIRKRLDVLAGKPRADVPGLTNKGRFALMDLVDSASRGWK